MNVRRVAALLRELAEALEQEEPVKPRKRPLVEPKNPPPVSPETMERVQRKLRKAGVAA